MARMEVIFDEPSPLAPRKQAERAITFKRQGVTWREEQVSTGEPPLFTWITRSIKQMPDDHTLKDGEGRVEEFYPKD